MVTPEQIPDSWCRMWSEDATLAHELLTDDARQWSGVAERLDSVAGPASMTEFVRAYQRNVGNTFAARTLVIDGNERLAYTWDATRPDGTAVTGIDVCVLQDGVVTLNWTVPAAERSALPDGPGIEVLPPNARALDRAGLTTIAAGLQPLAWRPRRRRRTPDRGRRLVRRRCRRVGRPRDHRRGRRPLLVAARHPSAALLTPARPQDFGWRARRPAGRNHGVRRCLARALRIRA
jgi:hypothetical protein